MSTSKIFRYDSDGIVVTYEARRCIHAEACVHGLPAAFDPKRKPWVDAGAAPADDIARVIERCPTGALQYQRKDGGPHEAPPPKNTVRIAADGPLYFHGRVQVNAADGQPLARETRVALCRCGKSALKPFCDGSHTKAGFKDAGAVSSLQVKNEAGKSGDGALVITCSTDGSLGVGGDFELVDAKGGVAGRGNLTWLCRCGGSGNKPFCDGTHKKIGFKSN
ncbi:MAG: hypothetical protein A3I02_04925 [Betaproteobacteria bacterium RIFCSPLOWO2_02_FULL_67_26]|nr:MAG: hypothetical protein A3I02_04925 [Betaproteobacteria bacterium RIFCSPLOWO2_02_FULL_67_26]